MNILHTFPDDIRRFSFIEALTWAFLTTFIVGSFVLYFSLHYGVLQGPIQWDDCIIVLRGIANLNLIAQATTFGGMAARLIHLDIHAPLSDIQVMLGLLFTGGSTIGPFILSSIWLLVSLTAILLVLDRRNWPLVIAIIVFVCTQPVTINSLTYIKSDWKGGVLLCSAMILLAEGHIYNNYKFKIWGSVLLSLAILSKLTEFYLPIFAVAVISAFQLYTRACARYDRHGSGSPDGKDSTFFSKIFFLECLISTVPFLLFFLWKIRGTLRYIGGATSGIWLDNRSIIQRVYFYSPANKDSWHVWGNGAHCFVIFLIIAICISIYRKKYSYLGLIFVFSAIGATFFAPLFLANVSDLSFSATAIGAIMAASILSIRFIGAAALRYGGTLLLACMALIVAFTRVPLSNSAYFSDFSISGNEQRALSVTYEEIVSTMVNDARSDTPGVMVFYDQMFAPFPNIAIKYFDKTGHLPAIERIDDLSSSDVRDKLAKADYALTIVPSEDGTEKSELNLFPRYPISRDPAQADRLVRSSGRFFSAGAFKVPGGEIHLYASKTISPLVRVQ